MSVQLTVTNITTHPTSVSDPTGYYLFTMNIEASSSTTATIDPGLYERITPVLDAMVAASVITYKAAVDVGNTIYKVLATGGTSGTADDVAIYIANAPFKFRILDVKLIVSTNVSSATVTLRDTAGGAGAALSDALSVTTTGIKRDAALTVLSTVAAGGSLYVHRSDRSMVGEIVITIERFT